MDSFNSLTIADRQTFNDFLSQDRIESSELTFTNLFMWHRRYCPIWTEVHGCLATVLRPSEEAPFALQPVGPGDKAKALDHVMDRLGEMTDEPKACRIDRRFMENFVDPDRFEIREDRDNSDYVYLSENLIKLSGNKLHKKKNHLNRFLKTYQFEYRDLDTELVKDFLELQDDWCELKKCLEDPDLLEEDMAVYEALTHFQELGFSGGAIVMDSKVEAYALGERLNEDTAVIHVEKSNPDISGLSVAISNLFCKAKWSQLTYVNREQDLGLEGLRKAKMSYRPHHLVEKFTLIPKD
jgi:uncharacterized protein